MEPPTTEEIKGYVADFREFLKEGTFPERKALIRNFVEGIEVTGDEAVLTYTIPMPSDGVTAESASVLDFVQSGPPNLTVDRTGPWRAISSASLPGMGAVVGHRNRDSSVSNDVRFSVGMPRVMLTLLSRSMRT